MRPVHDLVTRACQEYDKSAGCLTRAHEIWNPIADQNSDTVLGQLLDCGRGAQAPGGILLAEANATGLKILLPN
jgi:hypothetical protein